MTRLVLMSAYVTVAPPTSTMRPTPTSAFWAPPKPSAYIARLRCTAAAYAAHAYYYAAPPTPRAGPLALYPARHPY